MSYFSTIRKRLSFDHRIVKKKLIVPTTEGLTSVKPINLTGFPTIFRRCKSVKLIDIAYLRSALPLSSIKNDVC